MKEFVSAPQQLLLLTRKVVVWRMNREVELVGIVHQLLLPPLHRLSLPARNGVFEDRATLVWYDQILVNADHLAITFAARAGSNRIVETEKVFGRLLECYSVQLKAR